MLQPLDSSFFRVLKDYLRYALEEGNRTSKLEKYSVLELLVDPWHKATAPGTITSSFEIPGIWPLNKEKWERYFKSSDIELLNYAFHPNNNAVASNSNKEPSFSMVTTYSYQVQYDVHNSNLLVANNKSSNSLLPDANSLVPVSDVSNNIISSSSALVPSSNALVPLSEVTEFQPSRATVEIRGEVYQNLAQELKELKELVTNLQPKSKKTRINSSKNKEDYYRRNGIKTD